MIFKRLVPEIPVKNVEAAQQYYRDIFGFRIDWITPEKEIGAVSNDKDAVVFFRKRSVPFEPAVHWIFAENVDAACNTMMTNGANIVDDIENKPWGMRQFTVEDLDGNRFYIHHDLP